MAPMQPRISFPLTITCCVLLLTLMTSHAQAPANDCERDAHPVTELGQLVGRGKTLTPTDFPYPIDRPATRYLRLRLEVINPPDCDWYLTVRDKDLQLIETLTAEDFKGSANQWTRRVYGRKAVLDLETCPGEPNRPGVMLQEYLAMPEKTDKNPYYSKQHNIPEWKPLYVGDDRFRSWGDYVGLMIGSWNSREVWTCSGVMIASDLFLTNWHCGSPRTLGDGTAANPFKPFPETGYWDEETILKDILIDTSWDSDNVSRDFRVTRKLACSKDLDFAILEVKPINSSGKVRPVRIAKGVSSGDHIWIVQHPLAMPKQISNCIVITAETPGSAEFTHQCDTEAGSSGAPVFNSDGDLVGIHHKGFELDKDTCKPLLPKLNRAVRIDKIMAFLRDTQKYTPVYDRIPRK